MITAHIKSPFGDRTEEWDDNKVKADFKQFQREFDVYLVGYEDDNGKEVLGYFDKEYWEIHEEVLRFFEGLGSYPGLMAFLRSQLKTVGGNFQQYMPLERQLLEQAAIPEEQLEDIAITMDKMGEENKRSGTLLEDIVRASPAEQPPEQPEATIYEFMHALYNFTFLFDDSMGASRSIIRGLALRAVGDEYSSLDYLRELNVLRKAVEARQQHEALLTSARKQFLALPPEGIALRSEPAAPLPEVPEESADATTEPASDTPPGQAPPAA